MYVIFLNICYSEIYKKVYFRYQWNIIIKNIRETIKLNNIGEHSLFCKDIYIIIILNSSKNVLRVFFR